MHWTDDIVTAILAGIASFLAILAAKAIGWFESRKPPGPPGIDPLELGRPSDPMQAQQTQKKK
jgi:hypothetical protein